MYIPVQGTSTSTSKYLYILGFSVFMLCWACCRGKKNLTRSTFFLSVHISFGLLLLQSTETTNIGLDIITKEALYRKMMGFSGIPADDKGAYATLEQNLEQNLVGPSRDEVLPISHATVRTVHISCYHVIMLSWCYRFQIHQTAGYKHLYNNTGNNTTKDLKDETKLLLLRDFESWKLLEGFTT